MATLSNSSPEIMKANAEAAAIVNAQLAPFGGSDGNGISRFLSALPALREGKVGSTDFNPLIKSWEQGEVAKANAIARELRKNPFAKEFALPKSAMEGAAYADAMQKSTMDVGSLTNLAQVTGGQALGFLSMDTRMARGTIRPNSFTLYNMLNKTAANQIVDYFAYASSIGQVPVGGAFASYASQTNTVQANNGDYSLKYLNLKLALDGRALTVALATQNSFVDIAGQENANAALTILSSVDWAIYWGNPLLYPNQPQGIAGLIPSRNTVDFQQFFLSNGNGLSPQQALYNLVYEQAAFISGYRQFGQITHAIMTPTALGDVQSLITGRLDNFLGQIGSGGIVINGDLQGVKTRFGDIQFPMDFFITARDTPLQAVVKEDGTNYANANIVPATSISGAVTGGVVGSDFTAQYAGGYSYAVAATDSAMNESVLTYSQAVTGVAAGGGVTLTITPNGSAAQAFRVFRSGLGYAPTGTPNPASFKHIGDVIASGSAPVTFVDTNAKIPGSETIFLLDLDENDMALDYRFLLPLTRVELFSGGLFAPWAVAHIGAPRLRIPKFNGMIRNYVPANPQWSPLSPNPNAS